MPPLTVVLPVVPPSATICPPPKKSVPPALTISVLPLVRAAGVDAAFAECATGGAAREDPKDATAQHFDAGARFTGGNIERLTAAHRRHGNRPLPCIPLLACARSCRAQRVMTSRM